MKAVRIMSSSASGGSVRGRADVVPDAVGLAEARWAGWRSAFRASTSAARASSRFLPNWAEFSTSISVTTSAPAQMAATILSCWRLKFSAFAAPRTSQPPLTVMGLPSRSVKNVAAGDLVAGGGEVVQHVERGELQVAATCAGASVRVARNAGRLDACPRWRPSGGSAAGTSRDRSRSRAPRWC